jgi:hypothetical protein
MLSAIQFRILLSSRLLPKNVKIRIYEIVILSATLEGCENWPLILNTERSFKASEKRLLRGTFE